MAVVAKTPAELMWRDNGQCLLRPLRDDQSGKTGLLGKGGLREIGTEMAHSDR